MKNLNSEKYTEKKLVDEVKKLKGLAIKLLPFNFTGLPDRMVLLPGAVIYFVETKSKGDKPRPRQLFVHKQFNRLGFPVLIIDTKTKLDEFITKVTTS